MKNNFSKCKSCGVDIAWVKTKKGNNMPVDADLNYHGEEMFIRGQHTPHFSTCPWAEEHKRLKNENNNGKY